MPYSKHYRQVSLIKAGDCMVLSLLTDNFMDNFINSVYAHILQIIYSRQLGIFLDPSIIILISNSTLP